MDIKTGLSIYNKPWLIEPQMAGVLLDAWLSSRGDDANKWQKPAQKAQIFDNKNIAFAPDNSYEEFKGFDGATVACIPVSGPLMKNDFCGYFGTATLTSLVKQAAATASVKTIVMMIDSPGGTVDGTEDFANAIKASGKETIAFISGYCCSAAYWVASACSKIYASCNTDKIGCIGTMITLVDSSEYREKSGRVIRTYYATDSKDKNKEFEAAEKGDGKALIEGLLDPVNDVFLNTVRSGRPNVNAGALTGKTFVTAQAKEMGLIDGVASFDQVAANFPITTTIKNKNMTLAEFKAQHPALAAEHATEVLAAEKDRAGAWLVFQDVDAAAVKAGLESGLPIGQKQMAEFALKAQSKNAATAIENDGAENEGVKTPESKVEGQEEKAELDALKKEIKANAKQLLQLQ